MKKALADLIPPSFKKNFSSENPYNIQSFTYFIPAPSQASQGYQEKQFDQIFSKIIEVGYEVVEYKTQALNSERIAGLWVLFLLRPLNETAAQNKIDITEVFAQDEIELQLD
ncbi:MAG: hypothetical protein ACPGJV_14710 [Bacteriovoracaceae bacterium]